MSETQEQLKKVFIHAAEKRGEDTTSDKALSEIAELTQIMADAMDDLGMTITQTAALTTT